MDARSIRGYKGTKVVQDSPFFPPGSHYLDRPDVFCLVRIGAFIIKNFIVSDFTKTAIDGRLTTMCNINGLSLIYRLAIMFFVKFGAKNIGGFIVKLLNFDIEIKTFKTWIFEVWIFQYMWGFCRVELNYYLVEGVFTMFSDCFYQSEKSKRVTWKHCATLGSHTVWLTRRFAVLPVAI